MVFDARESRGAFVAWLRSARDALVADEGKGRALRALGLDDAGLDAFTDARRVVVSLPHASPNVFFPRVGVSWYVRHLQRADPSAFHLRVALTHVNFSDLGWRPYAWWFLDQRGALARETLFTRNKKAKHVVVAGQPPLSEVPSRAVGADREAARLALHGTDRALSHLLLMSAVERAAGLTVPGRTLYLPLDLLVAFFRDGLAGADPAATRAGSDASGGWAAALFGLRTRARRLDATGRLVDCDSAGEAFVLDNSSNIALLSLLGCAGVVGGAKMAGYWGEIEERVERAGRLSGVPVPLPELLRLPDGVAYEDVVRPSPGLAAELAAAGIGYSQGMAVAEHGSFAEEADPFR
ncbi:hypothetical protein ACFYZ9_07605 [Streptomyces sp. NPDC001691]|uniref:hypothetical protein n=1 Tax=Streptomyces sp. NPDC001691 TaxID=3364600 RepID=UPI00368D6D89